MTCRDCNYSLSPEDERKDDGLCYRCRLYREDHEGIPTSTADLVTQYPKVSW